MSVILLVTMPMIAALGVYLLTGRVRGYAMHRLIDVPNERSSHVTPTPRGGGVAIAAITLAAVPLLVLLGALSWRSACGLFGAGALVAVIGFADDHAHVQARWRLLAHFVAAAWLVAWMGGLPPIPFGGSVWQPGWIGYPIAILYVVWLLNLSNFMDGIDGIAGIEVVTVCLGAAIVSAVTGAGDGRLLAALVVAGAALGFLFWNWPPARIFMGDVGSGFLGLVMAALSLEAGWARPQLFWVWLILLGAFIVDATVTLLRRTVRGDRFLEAHRTHAYQHAAARFGAHLPVTVATGLITLLWLLPIALLVGLGTLDGAAGVLIAYIPLVAIALWLKAGKPAG